MIATSLSKKKVSTTDNVTTSEEVEKGTKIFDEKKKAMVTTPFSKKTLLTDKKVTTSE